MIQNDRLIKFSLPVKLPCALFLVLLVLLVGMASGERGSGRGRRLPPSFARSVRPFELVEQFAPQPFDMQSVRDEDARQRGRGGPRRFAVRRPAQITPDDYGMWERIDDQTLLWRLQVTSPEAVSIHLGFADFFLPSSASLHIYSVDHDQVLGPFTQEHNKPHGRFWTPIIKSDDIVVELSVDESQVDMLGLKLTSINHGYRQIDPALKSKSLGSSGSCNVNVACSAGDPWRDQTRSVALYYVTGAYSYTCTGTLINNTSENETPYFLTAFHCLDQADGDHDGIIADPDEIASSVTVYWNFEAQTCNGITASLNQVQTGSGYRAGYEDSDFVLLELDDIPSSQFGVYYAGWDRSSAAPSSAAAIHHPYGDMKKISIDDDPLSITMFGENVSSGNGSHLRVVDWDAGTTESGSSGCGLFNSSKRVVGQLHGGDAACGNNLPDWFGRFYSSWTGGGTTTTCLSDWLDPIGSLAVWMDGKDARVPVDSYEPDDSYTAADQIATNITQVRSIMPAADVDWVKFTIDSVSEVVIETSGIAGDTEIRLYDDNLVEIDYDNESGTGNFSRIERLCGVNALVAGTYYVRVNEYGDDDEIISYDLDLAVIPSAVGDLTGDCCVDFADLGVLAGDWLQCRTFAFDKLNASDAAQGDYFGRSVSISAEYAVVGAPYDSSIVNSSGAAYIFKRTSSAWVQQAKIVSPNPAEYDFFGFSVSIDGEHVLIGARGADDNGSNSGAAFVFRRQGVAWVYQSKILAPDGSASDYFGYSVSVSGDYVLIGAPYDDDFGSSSGTAYVFQRSLNTWQFKDKIVPADGAASDYFGRNVSLSGNYAAIGSYHDDDDGSNSGSVYVFSNRGVSDSWSQDAKLTASDASEDAVFGNSVSINNRFVIVGAWGGEGRVDNTGSAYIFERDDSGWIQRDKLIALDGNDGDFFGASVAMGVDMAVVGANLDNDNAGSAYVFVRDGEDWKEQSRITASDGQPNDEFGYSVSISRRSVIIGAYGDSDFGDSSGSAHIFEVGDASSDISGDGCVDMSDLALIMDNWLECGN